MVGLRPGGGKIFLLKYIKNPTKCMWSGCHLPNAEVCPGSPPPYAAHITVTSGEKGLWVVWYNSGVVRLRHKRGKIQICLRVITVLVVGINPVTAEW